MLSFLKLLICGALTLPLIIILGWQAFIWLMLLLLGVVVAVWMSIVATLMVFRYVIPHLKRAAQTALVICIGIGIVYIALCMVGFTLRLPAFSMPSPLIMILLLLMALILVAGPCANLTGSLYIEAFHEMEGQSRSRVVINAPGIRLLSKWLRRYRNLTGALLTRGLLNQSRNVFTWGRLVIVLVCIAIRTLLIPFGFSTMLLAVMYASGVTILAMIDYAPYAISSEGSHLVAPTGITTYLRSRLTVLLIAALTLGLRMSLALSWWIG